MNEREALTQLAALCAAPYLRSGYEAELVVKVRAILANVTPEPGVTLTPEEAALIDHAIGRGGWTDDPADQALAARLEAVL
jgi:hypothetical protein